MRFNFGVPLPDPPATVTAAKSQLSHQAAAGRAARSGGGRSGRGKAGTRCATATKLGGQRRRAILETRSSWRCPENGGWWRSARQATSKLTRTIPKTCAEGLGGHHGRGKRGTPACNFVGIWSPRTVASASAERMDAGLGPRRGLTTPDRTTVGDWDFDFSPPTGEI